MWTPAARAQLARDDIPYATSLTDQEWAVVAPFMPTPARTGRPRLWPMRLVFDGVQYLLRTGCAWAHLPRDFPPHETALRWFLRLSRSGAFEAMMRVLTALERARAGRNPLPTAATMDAQAAPSGTVGVAGQRGYDPARRVVGRKRHALVDPDRRLLGACVSPASARQPRRHRAAARIARTLAVPAALLRRQRLCRAARGRCHGHRRYRRQRPARAEGLCRPAPALGH